MRLPAGKSPPSAAAEVVVGVSGFPPKGIPLDGALTVLIVFVFRALIERVDDGGRAQREPQKPDDPAFGKLVKWSEHHRGNRMVPIASFEALLLTSMALQTRYCSQQFVYQT